jgi:hypothetical protein
LFSEAETFTTTVSVSEFNASMLQGGLNRLYCLLRN